MLDKSTAERLRRAIKAWGTEHLNADQQHACSEAVEFLRHARVVRCSVHMTHLDTKDGPVVTRFRKARMEARMSAPDRTVRRTVAMTANPFAQVLRAFDDFEWDVAFGLQAALRPLIPRKQWAALASQLAVRAGELERDPVRQAAIEERLETARRRIFEKEREDLLRETERLLRRGWSKEQIDGVVDEAIVKSVMES